MNKLKIEILQVAQIKCEKCDNWEEYCLPSDDIKREINQTSKLFSEAGWKVVERKTLCPDCVIKQKQVN